MNIISVDLTQPIHYISVLFSGKKYSFTFEEDDKSRRNDWFQKIDHIYNQISDVDIEKINETFIKDADTPKNFSIIKSKLEGNAVNILPDLAICSDCTDELFDTKNKRYGDPLNNCTQCGPRFSIIYNTPYDRSRTSLSRVKMGKAGKNEYDNPEDRRFHAQPIACDKCGPKVTLEKISKFKDQIQPELIWEQLDKIKNLFLNDKIIAIQGIGGFHLACNAKNHEIIEKLRLLKNRYEKPFAVMGKDIEMIKRYCFVTQSENKLLISSESPIVLLKKRNVDYLPKNIAPGQKRLGFMLPYSPIHKLLFHEIDGDPTRSRAREGDEIAIPPHVRMFHGSL